MKLLLVLMVLVSGALGAQPYTEVQGEREFSGRMICLPTPGNLSAASAYIPNDTVVPATGQIYFPLGAGQTENQCHDELMAMGIFEYVEPDWVVFLTAVPNDPIYPQQWHHGVLGSEAGWDVHTGDLSVTVAICDTGWEPHQDLSVGWRDNYNATTQLFVSQGGDASAVHYHGNATTGVAAATGNNGLGVTGVGWNLSKRMLRVSENSTGSANLSVIQHAVRTAAQQGDQCISVSYSGCDNLSNLTTATYARELGSLLFWSGGNDNRGLTLGNRDLDDIIIVGGTDQSDSKASFSAHGEYLDLSGPAVGITTTTIGTGGTYINASGTSFSCPMAAGVAALIFSADPTLTADEVELLLKMGCDDKGVPGIDDTYGHGRLSLQGSLALIGSPAFHTLSIAEVTGTPGVVAQVPVTLQNPEPVHGFSFGVMHDVSVAQFTTLSPGTGLPQPPEYWQGTHYATQGGFTVAAILSLSAPVTTIPAGEWEIVEAGYMVIGGNGTALEFTGNLGNPPLAVEVSVGGAARVPATVPGSITVGNTFRRGDVNLDQTISISDPISLLVHMFSGGPIQCRDAGDVDDSGTLNLNDAMYLLAYAVTGGAQPPAPFTLCGDDPTTDTLDCASGGGC